MHALHDKHGPEWPDCGLPPRSRFFNLPPVGLDSPRVESLTSYLVRLARAHSVSCRLLIKTEFVEAEPGLSGIVEAGFFRRYAGTINGLGKYAEMFTGVTVQLTTVAPLRQLTLLPLARLLPHNGTGLLVAQRQWCPECLTEMGREPFWPLIWSIKSYQVCDLHGIPMQRSCPGCSRQQPFLPRYPSLDCCAYCGTSLASYGDVDSVTERDAWLAMAIADFVGQLSLIEPLLTHEHLLTRLSELLESQGHASKVAFLREMGLPRWLLNHWFNSGERASFAQLLRLCYGLDIKPADFFLPGSLQSSPRIAGNLLPRKATPRLTENERHELGQKLNRVVESGHDPQPICVIARDEGLTRAGLKYLFPVQYAELQTKNRLARQQRALIRYRYLVQTISLLVEEMKERGEYPGRRKINMRLQEWGASLAEPMLLAAYRKEVAPHASMEI